MDHLLSMKAFARVVEVGSFTKAADSLDIPNSTLTRLIQSLEARLGVKLLHRTTRRISVTEEGIMYYGKTTHLLKELDAVETSISAPLSRPHGNL